MNWLSCAMHGTKDNSELFCCGAIMGTIRGAETNESVHGVRQCRITGKLVQVALSLLGGYY